jgi:hypothetical protein
MHFSQWFIHLQKAFMDFSLEMVWMALSQLVLKLSWDNKMPANSDFALGKMKMSAGTISGE